MNIVSSTFAVKQHGGQAAVHRSRFRGTRASAYPGWSPNESAKPGKDGNLELPLSVPRKPFNCELPLPQDKVAGRASEKRGLLCTMSLSSGGLHEQLCHLHPSSSDSKYTQGGSEFETRNAGEFDWTGSQQLPRLAKGSISLRYVLKNEGEFTTRLIGAVAHREDRRDCGPRRHSDPMISEASEYACTLAGIQLERGYETMHVTLCDGGIDSRKTQTRRLCRRHQVHGAFTSRC
jgi:hypothetical protein